MMPQENPGHDDYIYALTIIEDAVNNEVDYMTHACSRDMLKVAGQLTAYEVEVVQAGESLGEEDASYDASLAVLAASAVTREEALNTQERQQFWREALEEAKARGGRHLMKEIYERKVREDS